MKREPPGDPGVSAGMRRVAVLLGLLAALTAGAVLRPAGDPAGASEARPPDTGRRTKPVTVPKVVGRPPEFFLSWNAPYDDPGARADLVTACDDTTRSDTLYLSFDPGRSGGAPSAMEAVLYFHPASGDTLGPFWFFKRGWPNNGNLLIEFDWFVGFPCQVPWPQRSGNGHVSYDHRSGRGRLDLSFTIEPSGASGITAGVKYCMARVLVHQRRAGLDGCLQPVCVEWASLRLRPRFGREIVVTHGTHRFVTWNAVPGRSCASRWPSEYATPWRPNVPTGQTPAALTDPTPPVETGAR